jgi:hypothetical protein
MIAQNDRRSSAIFNEMSNGQACCHQSQDLAWQHRFLRMYPAVRRYAVMRFRSLPAELREEMVAETIARALLDYVRLVERDKEHLASATPLARYAISQVRAGRRVGCSCNGRDVSSQYCQIRHGVSLQSLDAHDERTGGWQEILVEDRHAGPAEVAASRIDFEQWLQTLPRRNRQLAKRLAIGETTSSSAREFGISSSRVSQLRGELCQAWHSFQGEAVPTRKR